MTHRRCLFVLLLIGLTGCGVASVSPAVTDADVAYDPRLLGTWQDSARTESAVITAAPQRGYNLLYTDSDKKTGRFHARLGVLDRYRVLDVQPVDPSPGATDVYKSLLLRAHGVLFIDSIGALVRFRELKGDSVSRYIDRNPRAITHTKVDDAILLTAPSPELRQFLIQLARRPGMLGDPTVWRRKAP